MFVGREQEFVHAYVGTASMKFFEVARERFRIATVE